MARPVSSAIRWPAITPHDTNRIATGKPVAAGEIKPVQPLIIKSTGTTATPLYGLYNE